jgi:GAF domain-containing protein
LLVLWPGSMFDSMGQKVVRSFAEAEKLGGLLGRIRLATLARIASTEAAAVADSPELLARVEQAMTEVRAEFAGRTPPADELRGKIVSRDPDGAHLRRHLDVLLELMTQRGVFIGDVRATAQRITESAAVTLGVERVSVWFADGGLTKITCADLFERTPSRHTSGVELSGRDFAPYFRALKEERTIAAHDALTDPRTSCFADPYLRPLGIGAMLDVPVWLDRQMVGVLCHEHVGGHRPWTKDDERFAYLMASFVVLALERRRDATASPRPLTW